MALNKALHSPLEDRRLKAKGYEQLSVHAFDQKNYLNAAAYLDSTLNFLESKTRKHRALTRKRASLDEIITYEKTIEKTDSILALVEMSPEKRQLFFEEMLQEQEKARQKMAAENAIAQQGLSGSALSNPMGAGTFYFYSPNQLMMGKQQFKNTWKDRAAVDNWRYVREKAVVAEVEEIEVPKLDFSAAAKELVATIPSNPKEIDSLRENRAGAYYDAGLSYKEQFNDLSLSAERLTQFIETDLLPKRRPAALYHLYRAFEKIDPQQLVTTKAQLQAAYPDSKYLKILENPAAMKADLEIMHQQADSLMANYGRIDFEKTISEVEALLKKDIEPALAAKLSLLNAKAIGRLDGPEAYLKALENIVAQYPKQESGLEAASLMASIQTWEAPTYDFESNEPSKLVFLFDLKEKPQAISLTEKLNKILAELENEDLSISLDRYDRSQFMVVVHGFRSRDAAEGFSEMIQKTPAFLVNRDNFVILFSDFKKALIFKHLDRFIKP